MQMLGLLKEEDRNQTALRHGCNISHPRTVALLAEMVESCLVVWNERTDRYFITPTGESALVFWKALRELI